MAKQADLTRLGTKVSFVRRNGLRATGKVTDHRHLQNGLWVDVDSNSDRKRNPAITTVRPSQLSRA